LCNKHFSRPSQRDTHFRIHTKEVITMRCEGKLICRNPQTSYLILKAKSRHLSIYLHRDHSCAMLKIARKTSMLLAI
jgi:hypothetical protein